MTKSILIQFDDNNQPTISINAMTDFEAEKLQALADRILETIKDEIR